MQIIVIFAKCAKENRSEENLMKFCSLIHILQTVKRINLTNLKCGISYMERNSTVNLVTFA